MQPTVHSFVLLCGCHCHSCKAGSCLYLIHQPCCHPFLGATGSADRAFDQQHQQQQSTLQQQGQEQPTRQQTCQQLLQQHFNVTTHVHEIMTLWLVLLYQLWTLAQPKPLDSIAMTTAVHLSAVATPLLSKGLTLEGFSNKVSSRCGVNPAVAIQQQDAASLPKELLRMLSSLAST